MSGPVPVNLTSPERELLARGLSEWGGPARATDLLARAMGFSDSYALLREGDAIIDALRTGKDLSRADWARALVATELAFASDYYGSGVEWPTTVGMSDEETVRCLREVQRKLVGVARPT